MKSATSAFEAPPVEFNFSPAEGARWNKAGPLEYRELGFGEATAGQMGSRNWRSAGAGTIERWPETESGAFRMLFVLSGTLSFETESGKTETLAKLDTIHQPLLAKARDFHFSDDFEIMDLRVPDFGTAIGLDAQAPIFKMEIAPGIGADINRDEADAYKSGKGPRSFMLYRDLGSVDLTDRRIHTHIVKVNGDAPAGGTGWHYHSMGQIFYVLTGEGAISVNRATPILIASGDAMSIGAGMLHNVSAFSRDYSVIEVCLPADYDTIPAEAPQA